MNIIVKYVSTRNGTLLLMDESFTVQVSESKSVDLGPRAVEGNWGEEVAAKKLTTTDSRSDIGTLIYTVGNTTGMAPSCSQRVRATKDEQQIVGMDSFELKEPGERRSLAAILGNIRQTHPVGLERLGLGPLGVALFLQTRSR